MYTVNIREVSGFTVPNNEPINETMVGLAATIEPPINLNPEAVKHYIGAGNLLVSEEFDNDNDLSDVVLVGSTEEATTIFATIADYIDDYNQLKDQMAERTVGLLNLLGAEAIVGNVQYRPTAR